MISTKNVFILCIFFPKSVFYWVHVGQVDVSRCAQASCHVNPGGGTGSGQQSVTGVASSEDSNSYWSVRGTSDAACSRGTPVKCGQTIRLTHVNTRRNLHSHYFASPLSSNQVGFFSPPPQTQCPEKYPFTFILLGPGIDIGKQNFLNLKTNNNSL